MAYQTLTDFIKKLEEAGELIRIKEYVNPELEISEITDRVSKMPGGGKALLFENTGTEFPLLINAFGSEKRMNLSLNVNNLDEIGAEIESLFKSLTGPKSGLFDKLKLIPELGKVAAYMPKQVKGRGKSQEVVHQSPDLGIFPILKCWPADGGKFITFPLVITKDPLSGIRNVGMYRMQVFDKDLTGMHWHKHKVGARHYNEYKKLGKKMPIAVALGGDPALTYSATAPLPDNVDEFMLAGFLRKQKVKLVKAITQDIEVPADSDIVIEGYVDPDEELIYEGPFGDHTGFYSLADYFPKFHVTCITHRKDAVYPTTIVGIPPQEDAWLGKATERVFLTPIKLSMLPELTDMDLPYYGVAHNLTLVSIKKDFAGQALKVMSALWGAGQMMFNKSLVVVDNEVDVHDYAAVATAFLENVNVQTDVHFSMGPLDILDHSASKYAYGSKVCFDATKKFEEELPAFVKEGESFEKPAVSKIKEQFPFVKNVAVPFSGENSFIAFVAFEKNDEKPIKEMARQLYDSQLLKGVKLMACFDAEVTVSDTASSVWILTNNIDPKRDAAIFESEEQPACIAFDATKKTSELDKFFRDWPNIVLMDDETIKKIDNFWDRLNLGPFVKSPSEFYKPLVPNDGAILKKGKA
jgi:4-hydroxy-3-polyprenylbenzoate decarboxylase